MWEVFLNMKSFCLLLLLSLQLRPTLCDPMDTAHQAPPSTGFSRQEYWRGLLFLSAVLV